LIRASPTRIDADYDHILIFRPPFGAFPQELAEIYPFNTETVHIPDYESLEQAYMNVLKLIEMNPDVEFTFMIAERFEHPLVAKLKEVATII
jgi:7-cyano-7-deazaguanine tRNA-ribosyltransferase